MAGMKDFQPLQNRVPALQYLDSVEAGSVADRAGLRPGDFILAVRFLVFFFTCCPSINQLVLSCRFLFRSTAKTWRKHRTKLWWTASAVPAIWSRSPSVRLSKRSINPSASTRSLLDPVGNIRRCRGNCQVRIPISYSALTVLYGRIMTIASFFIQIRPASAAAQTGPSDHSQRGTCPRSLHGGRTHRNG